MSGCSSPSSSCAFMRCFDLPAVYGAAQRGGERERRVYPSVKFFSRRYYISTMANSFALSVSVTVFRCSWACRWPIFIICTRSRARGFCRSSLFCAACRRRLWARIPDLLLGRNGVITNLFKTSGRSPFPASMGSTAIVLVLCSQMFPLVFLDVSGALRNVDNTLLEASENMGCSGAKRFFTVVIPLRAFGHCGNADGLYARLCRFWNAHVHRRGLPHLPGGAVPTRLSAKQAATRILRRPWR